MKRMHVPMAVENLDQPIRFYSTLFASEPTVVKNDYAKWMLDDPRVTFAISTHNGRAAGLDHLGIQVENTDELHEVYDRLERDGTKPDLPLLGAAMRRGAAAQRGLGRRCDDLFLTAALRSSCCSW